MIEMLAEHFRVAWDGLTANKLRSFLTMLGVIIGVAAVVALLSIGAGAQAAIASSISSAGSNLLFVTPGTTTGTGLRRSFIQTSTLTYEDAETLRIHAPELGIVTVAPQLDSIAQVVYGSANDYVTVAGVTPAYAEAFNIQLANGRFIAQADQDRSAPVVVLGSEVAETLFGGFDPVGRRIRLATQSAGTIALTVIGVMEPQGGSMLANFDRTAYVPLATAQTRLFGGRNALGQPIVSRINLVAESAAAGPWAKEQVTHLLAERHRIGPNETPDFSVLSQAELLAMASEVSRILTVFLGAIASISLVVGGIGIMNMMLVAVSERTMEIGLRKAVGARRSDILTQFLLESTVLSLTGGIIGAIVGVVVSRLVNLSGLMRAVTPPHAILLAVGAAVLVGLCFGLYPASRASDLHPIEALRYE